MGELERAIELIENAKDIHVQWAEWQEGNPDWRDEIIPDAPGGPEHHREWVANYDLVLRVLRNSIDKEAK